MCQLQAATLAANWSFLPAFTGQEANETAS